MNHINLHSPGRLIALGFAVTILCGALLLLMPFSVKEGAEVTFIDALFTSTSAVCVTGLIAIDTADHFTAIGQGIVAVLIQIGGLGVTSVGVGLIVAAGKRVSIRSRLLVKEALNVDSYRGLVRLVKAIFVMTLCFEGLGALLSLTVFIQDYPFPHALGISVFHSIAAFNNSGFDILGGLRNLIPY
ncbi:MAG TPA: H(+)-transporting ATPase, partial [Candidatus Blautia gallistercoris]|nr:H(+)-transporting ATPase [Candidatus Blautia gallistercoris]